MGIVSYISLVGIAWDIQKMLKTLLLNVEIFQNYPSPER